MYNNEYGRKIRDKMLEIDRQSIDHNRMLGLGFWDTLGSIATSVAPYAPLLLGLGYSAGGYSAGGYSGGCMCGGSGYSAGTVRDLGFESTKGAKVVVGKGYSAGQSNYKKGQRKYGCGKSEKVKKTIERGLKDLGHAHKDVTEGEYALTLAHDMVTKVAETKPKRGRPKKGSGLSGGEAMSGEGASGGIKLTPISDMKSSSMAGGKPRNNRYQVVKRVMKDRGVGMIQASKIVKAENLYSKK